MTFEEWMRGIDSILRMELGVTTSDIADRRYRDMFDDGCSPREVAEEILDEGMDAL